ncbi:hypothetical protein RhiXN_10376 [Rhizoctonia solani]|uniref:Uncharacterized protein n=1 Tax=Rhizoctonia solani TaxID=456999 RepID=A0A8H8P488_9AGAM|nr:uncharacterized protein RhiXN_10376 [Rhizoctonia solani]QRW24052.1 hypothetical protein RhiXN_10376 [Rhizoctonia solani]
MTDNAFVFACEESQAPVQLTIYIPEGSRDTPMPLQSVPIHTKLGARIKLQPLEGEDEYHLVPVGCPNQVIAVSRSAKVKMLTLASPDDTLSCYTRWNLTKNESGAYE